VDGYKVYDVAHFSPSYRCRDHRIGGKVHQVQAANRKLDRSCLESAIAVAYRSGTPDSRDLGIEL